MSTFRIRAIDYIRGVNGRDYFDSTVGNQGNYAATGDADTYSLSDSVYPAKIGNHTQGEWYEYNVTVPQTGLYSVQLVYSFGGFDSGLVRLDVDKTFLAAFTTINTGNWSVSDRTSPQNVRLVAGNRRFRHTMQTNTCDFWGYEFNLIQADAVAVDIPSSYQFQTLSNEETYKAFDAKFGEGIEQSASAGLNSIRQKWSVQFVDMTQSEAIILRDIIRNAKGTKSVSWIPPLETQPLKWKIRSHTVNVKNGLIYSIGCTFDQVF